MSKYVFEGGVDFYLELYKSLDEPTSPNDSDDSNKCLITGEVLDNFHFTMNCNHKFNYIPLYKDLLNFKNKLCYMEISKYKTNEIRCPYCRKKQTTLMPYYEELGLAKVNGINDLTPEKSESIKCAVAKLPNKPVWITGTCCVPKCLAVCVSTNTKDNNIYCHAHQKEWKKLYTVQQNLNVTGFTSGTCIQLFKSGARKGQVCGATAYTNSNGCCKRHSKTSPLNQIINDISVPININENVIIG